ncbi:hypothetical protein HDV00_001366 [Rhizophlyctis rosea]|nr:hypothetical protein HDV00_001366 [Rhizophlyctis rosea]
MSEGSEIFDTYQKEYETLHESLVQKVNAIPTAAPDQRKLLSNEAERLLEEADELLSSMEVELSSLAQPIRTRLTPRLRSFKDDIKKVRRDLTKYAGQSERDQLLGSHVVDFEVASQDQRSRLLHGTERLQESSRRMEEARRIALETGGFSGGGGFGVGLRFGLGWIE